MKCADLFRTTLLGLALVAWPAGTHAQPSQSDTFFAEGRKLRQGGHCAEAIVVFRRSFELDPTGIGSLRNIAECEVELGRLAAARRSYWDLRRAALQTSNPRYEGWDKDAEKAYDALTPRVPRLTITVEGRREGITLTVDGMPLDPRLLGVEVEQDLGPHAVEVRFGAVTPLVEKITLQEGERRTLAIRVPAAGPADPSGPMGPVAPPPSRGLFAAGVAGLAVGGAALAAMGVSAGVREGALSEVKARCPSLQGCSPDLVGAVDRGQTASTLVNVFLGIAGIGLLGGGTLLLVDQAGGPRKAPTKTGVSMTVTVSPLPDAPGLRFEGRF